MKICFFGLLLILGSFVHAQNTFSFSDSVFSIGQVHELTTARYFMGSGHRLVLDSNQTELDSTIAFLQRNPKLQIEIGVHSDSRGNDSINLIICQLRANSSRSHFVSKGIPATQLIAKGYGEAEFIVSEEEIEKCDKTDKKQIELLHDINRRTELKIILVDP